MELIDYDSRWIACDQFRMTLECVGTEKDLATIQRVYNTGVYQLISLTGSSEKENKTMSKETKTLTATELCRIERDAYEKGYARGMETAIRAARSTYGFAWNNKDLKIKKVIFNDPATIVFWADGTKTVAKAHGDDKFDKEVGLTVCIAKKALGNRSNFDKVFKKWIK
jgi:hypothetical protein